ncbi:MAG: 2,3-bisphosphoglycerate-dependent phosphoglycerate mutase [Deltaproteobacteria bacterium]|nr:2,3-bisphosphoglycerate-dependent phosphoglycerate mutase [Deltaproteobacteria bacterium]
MSTLVLIRHGESLWNAQNRFTGWVDVPLTDKGRAEAKNAAEQIRSQRFDVAYTSVLVRAQETLTIILQELGLSALPVIKHAALNERDYGDLCGLNKEETAARYGKEIVHLWRRSFDIAPPGGESLKDTAARTLPFFERCIMGDLKHGRNVLVVAHGNSNRSIVMALEKLSPEQVLSLELATGAPRTYQVG